MSKSTLYVTGFGKPVESVDLAPFFEGYGPLIRLVVPPTKTPDGPPYAFVEFKNTEDAEKALKAFTEDPIILPKEQRHVPQPGEYGFDDENRPRADSYFPNGSPAAEEENKKEIEGALKVQWARSFPHPSRGTYTGAPRGNFIPRGGYGRGGFFNARGGGYQRGGFMPRGGYGMGVNMNMNMGRGGYVQRGGYAPRGSYQQRAGYSGVQQYGRGGYVPRGGYYQRGGYGSSYVGYSSRGNSHRGGGNFQERRRPDASTYNTRERSPVRGESGEHQIRDRSPHIRREDADNEFGIPNDHEHQYNNENSNRNENAIDNTVSGTETFDHNSENLKDQAYYIQDDE
ncbi:uncharacterized protein ASCRUDRAFT_87636 [Ascoidea rubescens DSM 1968]|uniref:RRM domain-containing protein n=1 Tax=Ascoidea rubescens DSM 1968 TaxID=1344418 RepID=A0A1D2VBX0_9ASCO|nr:hypothetical protein ASCRUDRAFT_87636 [Ascoidea rubescens DSM 1968]ODV59188.1 hypothetical protein ASCRUDRAFT_87636 [Ascoidea rubescens DSM 1968]